MEDMLKDYMLGEHLLLVGNQVIFIQMTEAIICDCILSREWERTRL